MKKILLLAAAALAGPLSAQVVVNEVSVSNLSNYPDDLGEYEDWVELYNTTAAPVDLGGWYLSNKVSNPMKWPIPLSTIIPANGRQVFFCSKRNTVAGGTYHTSFKLNQTDGDHVVLADPGGTIVDDMALSPRTMLGHSRGRTTDGAATWSLFLTPTPNAPNAGAGPEYAARPQLSPPAGFYGGATAVTMSTTDGSTIRYTLDGSDPTAASTAYAGPININATTVVRAACFSTTPGVPPSFIETNTYFINATHTVAVISIAGGQVDDLLDGDETIEPIGSLEYFGPDQQLRDEAVGEFNKHGNDSWLYDQRGIDYVARDQTGYNDAIHYPVFRVSERDEYQRLILKAGANDNYPAETGGAHIRDAFVHVLSQTGGLRLDERSYEPCVLYLNGQYWGVYEIREKCDDADYTKEYYDQDEYDLQYLKTWGFTWSEYGGPAAQADWDALRTYILGNDMGDATAFAYVDDRFNWKSLVDYVVLNSYVVCTDWLNWNTAWWRGMDPAGDHKKWGYVLWDNDAVFGHYINYTEVPDDTPEADPCNAEQLPDPGGQGHVPILQKLMDENQTVHDYYVNRYIDMGNTTFSCGHMMHVLDSLLTLINPEMPGQIARWGGTVTEWQSNVQAMKDFITERCTAIQQGLVDCYTLTGPYDVVYKVDPPLSGDIHINSVTPDAYPFEGIYYGGITTTLEAEGAEGWVFDRWETLHHVLAPGMTDSLATLQITTTDTIIAHFRPPIKYDIVLMVDPPNTGTISYDQTLYSALPATVQVLPESVDTVTAHPNMYYDFLYWEFKHNLPNSNDTTALSLAVTIFEPDTIIAHLAPQDYVYFGPNAFTPNGDNINDVWRPFNNVVDLENYDLRVYDRWGREVFASEDPYRDWDGTFAGSKVPGGVYAFKAFVMEALTRKRHDVVGHVTVVR